MSKISMVIETITKGAGDIKGLVNDMKKLKDQTNELNKVKAQSELISKKYIDTSRMGDQKYLDELIREQNLPSMRGKETVTSLISAKAELDKIGLKLIELREKQENGVILSKEEREEYVRLVTLTDEYNKKLENAKRMHDEILGITKAERDNEKLRNEEAALREKASGIENNLLGGYGGKFAFSLLNNEKNFSGLSDGANLEAASMFNLILSKTLELFKQIGKKALELTGHILKAYKAAKGKLLKPLISIAHVFKYMVLRMSFRVLIKDWQNAFNNFAKFSGEFNKQFSILYSSVKTTSNALVAAFAPAIQYLSPIVATLTNALNSLLNVLGKFNAVLFLNANTFTQAKKLNLDYAASLDKTKKSAGAASKQLAGFDTIMKLSDNSGSGSDELSPSDVFENVPIEEPIISFTEALKNVMTTGIGGWSLGDVIADNLNLWIGQALDKLKMDTIMPKVIKSVYGITSILNGIIDNSNAGGLGEVIGRILQTGIIAGWTFVKTFDFASAGVNVADLINNLFSSVDFGMLGETIMGFLMGLITFAKNLFYSIDWISIGFGIGDLVNGFIDTFDPNTAAGSINNLLHGLLNMIFVALGTIDWVSLGEKIGNFLISIDWIGIAIKLIVVLGEVIAALFEMLGGIIAGLLNGLLEMMFNTSVDNGTNLLTTVLRTLGDVIRAAWDLITAPFKDLFESVKTIITGIMNEESFNEIALDVVAGFKNGLSDLVSSCLQPFKDLWTGVKDFFGIHSPSKLFTELGGYVMQGFNKGQEEEGADESIFENMYNDIENGTFEATDSMIECWRGFGEELSIIFNNIDDMIRKELELAVTMVNKTMSVVESGLNNMVSSLNSIIDDYNDAAEELGERTISRVSQVHLSSIPIPKLATGGVIPSNNPFLAVLGDQKHGTNIEAPLDTIVEAFNMALSNNGYSRQSQVVLEVDGREFGKAVVDLGNNETRRVGTKMVY